MFEHKFVDLQEMQDVLDSQDEDLIESFVRLHDIGFDGRKNAASFSVSEFLDFGKLLENISLNNENKLGYILGYKTTKTGIREQFDILRFGNGIVLNIELKSSLPSGGLDQIERQLLRHRLYLNVNNPMKVMEFCYVKDEDSVYTLDRKRQLCVTNIETLETAISETNSSDHTMAELDLSSMIISPYIQIENFLEHRYYLTEDQYKKREEILKSDRRKIYLSGSAGSGKTLVLFDLAREYVKRGKSVVIFLCAPIDNTDISAKLKDKGISFFPIRDVDNDTLENLDSDIILVDEAQRIWQSKLDILLSKTDTKVIYCGDGRQIFHSKEKELDFHINPETDEDALLVRLKGKIRSDPAMASFISKLVENKRTDATPFHYKNVNLKFCGSDDSAREYISAQRANGFVVIEPTEYRTKDTYVLKRRSLVAGSISAHEAVGREYDNVLVLIDQYYAVSDDGLVGTYPSYYPYIQPKMIFEGLTRVKRNLTIVVLNNPNIYSYIGDILTWQDDLNFRYRKSEQAADKEDSQAEKRLLKDKDFSDAFDSLLQEAAQMSVDFDCSPEFLARKLSKKLK